MARDGSIRSASGPVVGWVVGRKAAPPVGGSGEVAYGPLDAYGKHRQPNNNDLLQELKNTAYTCASINAAVCASNPPTLSWWTASMCP